VFGRLCSERVVLLVAFAAGFCKLVKDGLFNPDFRVDGIRDCLFCRKGLGLVEVHFNLLGVEVEEAMATGVVKMVPSWVSDLFSEEKAAA
jgi:hypothetical protein